METAQTPKPRRTISQAELNRRFDTLHKFRRWKPEDGYKYEWNNGIVEKHPKMITLKTLFLVQKLNRLFQKTQAFAEGGELFAEPETMTSPTQLRVPDMAYYNRRQIREATEGQIPGVPEFAIEFISDTDSHKRVLTKLEEYFRAGMRVLWLIFPDLQLVYVYTSPIEVVICRDERVCTAAPVLPDFHIAASTLFDSRK